MLLKLHYLVLKACVSASSCLCALVMKTPAVITVHLSTSCLRFLPTSSPTASSPSFCFRPSRISWWVILTLDQTGLPGVHMVKTHAVLFYRPDFLPTLLGLKPTFEAFLCFALTMSLVSLASVSLAFLVSASASSFAMANILIALPFVFMMVRYQDTYS